MTKQVNVYEAKTQLSKLLEEVEGGAEITIARNGRPVARLVPLPRPAAPRVAGTMRGKIWLAPDWDDNTELTELMEDASKFYDEPDRR